MSRPTRDETLMEYARTTAKRGTCSRLQVGCVISIEGRVLSTGYNGAPAGMDHCRHYCNCGADPDSPLLHRRYHGRPHPAPGEPHHVECHSKQPCTVAVHDAANAIAWAARMGVSTLGAELHTTDSPCYECAKLIVNAGIVRVVWERAYRDTSGLDLLETAGVATEAWM